MMREIDGGCVGINGDDNRKILINERPLNRLKRHIISSCYVKLTDVYALHTVSWKKMILASVL